MHIHVCVGMSIHVNVHEKAREQLSVHFGVVFSMCVCVRVGGA